MKNSRILLNRAINVLVFVPAAPQIGDQHLELDFQYVAKLAARGTHCVVYSVLENKSLVRRAC